MKIISQGTYYNTVKRENEQEVLSEATLVASDFEGFASLRFRPDTYEITEARWAIHRASDPERRGEGTADMLVGESAYADDRRNSIKILPDYSYCVDYVAPPGGWEGYDPHKKDLRDEPPAEVSAEWELIRELFLECVRGGYQAEEYLLVERGIGTLLNYEKIWDEQKPGYCRPYYPDDMPALDIWPIHTGNVQHFHTHDLYNKYISFTIMDKGEDDVYAFGVYNDWAHEMDMEVFCGRDGVIRDYDMNVIRVPYQPCRELDHLNPPELIGMNMKTMTKRDIGRILGGSAGCFHMVDIVADLTTAMRRALPE